MFRRSNRFSDTPKIFGVPLFLATVLVAGCSIVAPPPVVTVPACSGEQRYIPHGTFPDGYPGSDRLRRQWYSAPLARLDEPSLSCSARDETYRMMWLHSFAHPVVIRITRHDRNVQLDAFQLSGTGAGDPGILFYHVHKQLSVVDWGRLQEALRQSAFWSMPTSGNMYGEHGEQWIVEGRQDGQYHLTDRWLPPAGAYRDLGVLFFDLAGWQRPDSSKY